MKAMWTRSSTLQPERASAAPAELTLFVSLGLFWGLIGYTTIAADWQGSTSGAPALAFERCILSFAMLVSAYGVMVPNSWQRALSVSLPLALTPLGLMMLISLRQPELAQLIRAAGSMGSYLALGFAVFLSLAASWVLSAWRSFAVRERVLDMYELTYLVDKITVSRVMTKQPIVVAPDTSVQEAAKLMADRKIGCLPVMVDGKLGGIVTDIDMLKLLARGG